MCEVLNALKAYDSDSLSSALGYRARLTLSDISLAICWHKGAIGGYEMLSRF